MSQKSAIVKQAAESSKKCFHCGLMNFARQARCARCRYDVWVELDEPKKARHLSDYYPALSRSKVGAMICATVLLSGLGLLYLKQDAQGTPVTVSEARVAHSPTQPAEQPGPVIAPENPQSKEAARHVLAGLKHFHGEKESSRSYEEYDEMLTRLKVDLNNTLPSFVDQNTAAQSFRLDVAAAIQDYTAAGNWWKTTIRNSSVFTDADRTERVVANWTSAKTHLDNAEQMLVR
jgi:hypothetical protein